MYKIAGYVTKVSIAKELERKVVVGILKAFSKSSAPPYFYPAASGNVPLPVVYVSPPIVWKNRSPQTLFSIVPTALLVIVCTCYIQLDRIETENIDPQVVGVAHKTA